MLEGVAQDDHVTRADAGAVPDQEPVTVLQRRHHGRPVHLDHAEPPRAAPLVRRVVSPRRTSSDRHLLAFPFASLACPSAHPRPRPRSRSRPLLSP
ncbi:hypothetical protein SFR_2035 [Streptomyces sp. FR-008]|nr:hypothetical protein SFR_2035 [Streptomyces sp. FR-008]